MDTMNLIRRFKEVTTLIMKCVGLALAVAVFVCLLLEKMQTAEAVKLLSLAVALLGVGVLSDVQPSDKKERQ